MEAIFVTSRVGSTSQDFSLAGAVFAYFLHARYSLVHV